MRQGDENYSDMGHSLSLNSTYDMGGKQATMSYQSVILIIDRRQWGPPSVGTLY